MHRLLPRSLAPLLVSLGLLAALAPLACSASARGADAPLSKLPPYEGRQAQLFADVFEPSALGLSLDRPTFRNNSTFRERAQLANGIANVKITTVTVGQADNKANYHFQLAVVGEPLVADPGAHEWDVEVREGNPSFGMMRQVDTRARGRTVIAMWRRFREGEEATTHWYFIPDDAETTLAVKEAIALQDLSHP